jgi:hypothetical protein
MCDAAGDTWHTVVCVCVCVTGVWTQDFVLIKQALVCLNHTSSPFALVVLEMGSGKLFAQAGLEPQSFWAQPLKSS